MFRIRFPIVFIAVIAVTALTALPAFADGPDAIAKTGYVFLGTTAGLDLHSTIRSLSAGNVEMNPLMGQRPGTTRLVLTKVATTGVFILLNENMRKNGHSRTAKIMTYAYAGVLAGFAWHNYKIARR